MATEAEITAAALEALKTSGSVKSVTTGADGSTTVVFKDNADVIKAAQFADQRAQSDPANLPRRRVAVGVTSGIRSCG